MRNFIIETAFSLEFDAFEIAKAEVLYADASY